MSFTTPVQSAESRSNWGVEESEYRFTQTLADSLPTLCATAQVYLNIIQVSLFSQRP